MSHYEQLPGMTVFRDDGIIRVAFDTPSTRNALDGAAIGALGDTIAGIRPNCVLVLTGHGGAFTSGGDRRDLAPQGTPEEQIVVLRSKAALVEQIRALDAVSIAAIDGACVGLGVGLAAACTLRVTSDRAFVDTAYLRLGLSGDFGAAHLLGSLVGRGTAADWLLRPRRIEAEELLGRGFSQAQWSTPEFEKNLLVLVREIAARSPVARQGMLANVRDADRLDLSHALDVETRRHVQSKSSLREDFATH